MSADFGLTSTSIHKIPPSQSIEVVNSSKSREEIQNEMTPLINGIWAKVQREFTPDQISSISLKIKAFGDKREITLVCNDEKVGSVSIHMTAGKVTDVSESIFDLVRLKQERDSLDDNIKAFIREQTNLSEKRVKGGLNKPHSDPESRMSVLEAALLAATEQKAATEKELFDKTGLLLRFDNKALPGGESVWSDYDLLVDTMLKHVPEIKIEHTPLTYVSAQKKEINNNGLQLEGKDLSKTNNLALRSMQDDDVGGTLVELEKGYVYQSMDVPKMPGVRLFLSEGYVFTDPQLAHNRNCAVTSQTNKTMTLCEASDASLDAKAVAVGASDAALRYMDEHLTECNDLRQLLGEHLEALKKAQERIASDGDHGTTFAQVSVTGNIVSGVVVGNTQVFAFVPEPEHAWQLIDLSDEGRQTISPDHPGGQLSENTSGAPDHLSGLRTFARIVPRGTLVLCCSSEMVNNFDPANLNRPDQTPRDYGANESKWEPNSDKHLLYSRAGVCLNVESAVQGCKSGAEIVKKLEGEVTKRVENENYARTVGMTNYIRGPGEGIPANGAIAYVTV